MANKKKKPRNQVITSSALSEEIDFHDSSLVDIEISKTLNNIKVVLFAPYEGTEWDPGRFYRVTFDAVLRMEFETTSIGENTGPLEIYTLRLVEDAELYRWEDRLARLADPAAYGYPKICYPERSYKGYENVYNVLLASSFMRGWSEDRDLEGIAIICRHIEIEDVTSQWSDKAKHFPITEEGGRHEEDGRHIDAD